MTYEITAPRSEEQERRASSRHPGSADLGRKCDKYPGKVGVHFAGKSCHHFDIGETIMPEVLKKQEMLDFILKGFTIRHLSDRVRFHATVNKRSRSTRIGSFYYRRDSRQRKRIWSTDDARNLKNGCDQQMTPVK